MVTFLKRRSSGPSQFLCLIGLLSMQTACLDTRFAMANEGTQPIVAADLVLAEQDGLVAVEAEHFIRQELTDVRAFYITSPEQTPSVEPDGDEPHLGGASGGAYVEVLPDTRRTHADRLIHGENFSNEPGKMAVLTYRVHFSNPGKYYVWARAYSSGSEDNGLHVGINGTWPASGQRLQWCQGKNSWRWESKQRTAKEHCGEPHLIFLDVPSVGVHEIHFSMREDGFEFDKWLMTTDREFQRPNDAGPASVVHSGEAPRTYPFVPAPVKGAEGGPETNAVIAASIPDALVLTPAAFRLDGTGYYLDKGKWAAMNPMPTPSKPIPGQSLSSRPPVEPRQNDDDDGCIEICGEMAYTEHEVRRYTLWGTLLGGGSRRRVLLWIPIRRERFDL